MELVERVGNIEKDLVTIKLDVGIIKATMATKADVAGLRGDNAASIADLKGDNAATIADLKGDNTLVKWMMGVLIALSVANFAKQFF